MEIFFADLFPDAQVAELERLGHRCHVETGLLPDDLTAAVSEADVVVVRSTPVSAGAIEDAKRLSLIVWAGAGTNPVDWNCMHRSKGVLL